MRIAIVSAPPEQVLVDKLGWVAQGFQDNGHTVRRCHTLQDVKSADRTADLLLFDHKAPGICHNSLADLASSRFARWVYWWRDLIALDSTLPLAEQDYIKSFKRFMRLMDAVLVKERSLLPEYRELGIRARWFDQACPANMPACEHRERTEWDVLVVGSASYDQRRNDARALADAGFRVLWVGLPCGTVPPGCYSMPWQHPTLELPQLVSRCAVVLSVDYRSDLDGYTSDRTYLLGGMGACIVRRESNGSPDVPSFSYADQSQLCNVVRMLVGNAACRKRTGAAARYYTLRHHTYHVRARSMLELLSEAQCGAC